MSENENSGIAYERFDDIPTTSEDVHKETDVQKIDEARLDQIPRSLVAGCLALLCVLLTGGILFLWLRLTEQTEALSYLDNGWKYSNFSIYTVSTKKVTWDQGRKDCKRNGADLVIINSKEEQKFVVDLASNVDAWIGLANSGSKVWKWVDGSALTTGFWNNGQPDSKVKSVACVLSGYGSEPQKNWKVNGCNGNFISICERPF